MDFRLDMDILLAHKIKVYLVKVFQCPSSQIIISFNVKNIFMAL